MAYTKNLRVDRKRYYGKGWTIVTAAQSRRVFDTLLSQAKWDSSRKGWQMLGAKSVDHLCTDYTDSAFLKTLGIHARMAMTVIDIDHHSGEVFCDYLVRASDGQCYDSAECNFGNPNVSEISRAGVIRYLPTPTQIAEDCKAIPGRRVDFFNKHPEALADALGME